MASFISSIENTFVIPRLPERSVGFIITGNVISFIFDKSLLSSTIINRGVEIPASKNACRILNLFVDISILSDVLHGSPNFSAIYCAVIFAKSEAIVTTASG